MPNVRKIIIVISCLLMVTGCSQRNNNKASQQCEESKVVIGSFVDIPTGEYAQTAIPIYTEERITGKNKVKGFQIQSHEVTVGQFTEFVEATGYITELERSFVENNPQAGTASFITTNGDKESQGQWSFDRVSNWQIGPTALADYPVVHITYNDALAYAKWIGGRLPTETEWEYVSWLGLSDKSNQTSGAFDKDGKPIANTWQGLFPVIDQGEDGFKGVAPVGCFKPNELGMFDMIGNVWEWTSTPASDKTHTIKGGSFLCAPNFCGRYRPAARQYQESDFSTNHIGFRVVRDQTKL